MKINKVAVLSVMIFIILCIFIGKSNETSRLKGKWEVVNSGSVGQVDNSNMLKTLETQLYSMVFAKGNQIEFVNGKDVIFNGTKCSYEFEDNKLTISDSTTNMVFDVDVDEQVTLKVNGFFIILDKVEF